MALSTNILVVEDDAIQRSLLTQLLAGQGHAVEGATDGFDAIRHLRRRHFDVVLMDYGLPDLSGLAAARLIAGLAPEAGRPRLIGLSITPEKMREQVAEAAEPLRPCPRQILLPRRTAAAVAAVQASAPVPGRPAAPAEPGPSEPGPAEPGPAAGGSLPPIRPATLPVHGQAPPADPAAAPIRVLLVDDDAIVRSIVEASLLAQGFDVETASDGLEAVQKLSRTRYAVVVLDIMMPGWMALPPPGSPSSCCRGPTGRGWWR